MTDENLPATEDDAGTAVAEPTAADSAGAEPTDEKKDKIDQAVEISDIGPCRKHIKVTVTRAFMQRLSLVRVHESLWIERNSTRHRP